MVNDIEYLNSLNILIVEDDVVARRFLKNILFEKFKEVRDASNGEEALVLYKTRSFDIVLTDVRMPKINGVDLVQNIFKINPKQHIIVISAYSDSEAIIKLLNLGVEKFILKPIEPKNLIETLKDIAKNIYNEKLVKEQQNILEEMNIKLIEKNRKLQKAIRIFETKVKQSNFIKSCKENRINDKNLEDIDEDCKNDFRDSILDDHIYELIELEDELEASTSIMFLREKFGEKELSKAIFCFNRYSQILENYPIFAKLGKNILILSNELEQNREVGESIQKVVLEYLESLIFTLEKWRREVFDGSLKDPNIYDNSMICDINTISLALNNKLNDIESDIEFF